MTKQENMSATRLMAKAGTNKQNVEFDADGVLLRGWLYRSVLANDAVQRMPAIVMSGGYGTTKEMFVDAYASYFAEAGFAVLLYDHRNFGDSQGEPRHEINPWQQVEDMRHAVTYLASLPGVDAHRIGVWGSSYSGGHAMVVAATDRRVQCVVVQVPTISGTQTAFRRAYGEAESILLDRFAEDRQQRAGGADPAMIPLMGAPGTGALYQSQDAQAWYRNAYRLAPAEQPLITLRSVEFARAYNPGDYIAYISPTPLLMQIGGRDTVTPTDLALRAYNAALEPKSLQFLAQAGHFDVYTNYFEQVSAVALNWFRQHLMDGETAVA